VTGERKMSKPETIQKFYMPLAIALVNIIAVSKVIINIKN